jgi:hypothetical protein
VPHASVIIESGKHTSFSAIIVKYFKQIVTYCLKSYK